MTLSSAFHAAVSGLSAGARLADLTAGNIANALTEGYGRREAVLSSRIEGQGVRVISIDRQMPEGLLQDLRRANATFSAEDRHMQALQALDAALGTEGDIGELAGRVATLERSLIEAAARPESTTRLIGATDAARAVATSFNAAAQSITRIRQEADAAIARDVAQIDAALQGIADLNRQISVKATRGEDASALLDQRQKLVDGISPLVGLREVARPGGQIALFTTTGITLLDGQRSARLAFSPTRVVTAEASLASGALSGLMVDGQSVSTRPEGGRFGGGALSASFALRDDLAPALQEKLDALAGNLISRFSNPGLDPTLAPGAPGLFTDAGGPVDPTQTAGLAGRLRLNALADPQAGGGAWRLRDGLGATQASAYADPALLQSFSAALSRPEGLTQLGTQGGFGTAVAELHSQVAVERLRAEEAQSFTLARREVLQQNLRGQGVDTDREMQMLLQIEQAYGANARVVRAIDDMMRTILEI